MGLPPILQSQTPEGIFFIANSPLPNLEGFTSTRPSIEFTKCTFEIDQKTFQ